MESARNVSELKSSFIRAQVRILSEALQPQEDWRLYAPESEEGDLSDKVVDDVLQKLNAVVKQHNRVVYSSQAIHHVAQQIASLYWSLTGPDAPTARGLVTRVERIADLSNSLHIGKLPPVLDDPEATGDALTRYQQMRDRLMQLNNQRQSRQQRLAQLQQLQRLLEPFKRPQENIQPNLVTRDGELAQELDRMRMLVARVAGRIGQHGNTRPIESRESSSSRPARLDVVLGLI